MTKLWGILFAVVAILGMGLGSSAQTQQNTSNLTFRIKSDYQYKIQLAFFSQDRNHVWPGKGNAYNIDDSKVHDIKLACQPGESICYGGWVTGDSKLYWGRGATGKLKCEACCYTCSNNMTPVIRLH